MEPKKNIIEPCECCGLRAGRTNAPTIDGEPGRWVCEQCAQEIAQEIEEIYREMAEDYYGGEE